MSITDYPIIRPTINLKATTAQSYAIFGHVVSMVGGFFMIVSGFFNLIDSRFLTLIGLIAGIFILIIELDQYKIPLLKEAINRGVAWILLGALSFGLDLLAIIIIFVGGAFYLAYHYQ